jgi:hypothetical protein
MKRKVVFLVCLLISAGLSSAVGEKSIAIPVRSSTNSLLADISTPATDLPNLVLTLQDLPAGFVEMPPATMQKLVSGLQTLKPASVFGYNKNDDQHFQIIIGFTQKLTNQIERAKFDADMREDIFAKEFSKGLNSGKNEYQFTNLTTLTLEEKIGEVSRGWTNQGKIQGVTMNLEIAVFRRGQIGSYLMILYLDGKKPAITMNSAARQLDKRIVELKPDLTQPQ